MLIKIIYLLLFNSIILYAKPQYTLLTGNRCINCHYDSQGGGIRNDLGWYSTKDEGLIKPKNVGLEGLHSLVNSNNIIGEQVSFGFDARIQSARLGGPRGSQRELFLMQATPYLRITPFSWLDIYGKYNFSDRTYTGQSNYGFEMKIQPGWQYPYLRVGYIQPLIGNRYDDHTIMLRNSTGVFWSSPMIPPDYHEYGAEIGYEAIKWLGVYAGIYSSDNLSDISIVGNNAQGFHLAENNELSSALKVKVNRNFYRNTIAAELGTSYLFNSEFNLFNIYANFGWIDNVAILTEFVTGNRKDFQEVTNFMTEVSYKILNPIIIYARYEKASTDLINNDETNTFNAEQIVLGTSLKVFPFIELRPEYRIFDRANYPSYAAQYAVQLHLYY